MGRHATQDNAAVLTARVVELQRRVAELEAELAATRRAAHHDGLTGLLNRDGLVAEWNRGRPRPLLALIDLDDFKPVNDRYGHDVGDALLIAAGHCLRTLPLAARLGGDEFVALVGGLGWLPTEISTTLPGGRTVSVTLSIGLAPVDLGDLPTVLRAADVAMYRAKAAGGGRWGIHNVDDRPAVMPRPKERLRDNARQPSAGRPMAVPAPRRPS